MDKKHVIIIHSVILKLFVAKIRWSDRKWLSFQVPIIGNRNYYVRRQSVCGDDNSYSADQNTSATVAKVNGANFCKTGYGSSSMEDLSNGAIPRFWNRFWVEIRRWGQTGADNQSITL